MTARVPLPPEPRAHPRVLVGQAVEVFGDWHPYWHRSWGARGLLYVWDEAAVADVLAGLDDEHWRVREMCLKVAIRRELVERIAGLERLVQDGNHRVRVAAGRALGAER